MTGKTGASSFLLCSRNPTVTNPIAKNRLIGLAGTAAIYAVILAGFFFSVRGVVPVMAPSALAVFDVTTPASLPEIPPKAKEAPKAVEEKKRQPKSPTPQPVERTIAPIAPASIPIPDMTPKAAEPGSIEPETAAPKTMPAPSPPQVSSNAPNTWEGRVLAALNKHRHYPRTAMARRQQACPISGLSWIARARCCHPG